MELSIRDANRFRLEVSTKLATVKSNERKAAVVTVSGGAKYYIRGDLRKIPSLLEYLLIWRSYPDNLWTSHTLWFIPRLQDPIVEKALIQLTPSPFGRLRWSDSMFQHDIFGHGINNLGVAPLALIGMTTTSSQVDIINYYPFRASRLPKKVSDNRCIEPLISRYPKICLRIYCSSSSTVRFLQQLFGQPSLLVDFCQGVAGRACF